MEYKNKILNRVADYMDRTKEAIANYFRMPSEDSVGVVTANDSLIGTSRLESLANDANGVTPINSNDTAVPISDDAAKLRRASQDLAYMYDQMFFYN
ncbi:MAG: hypothetical protein ACP5N1_07335 [Candidatus Woesearchaeota archaeon]